MRGHHAQPHTHTHTHTEKVGHSAHNHSIMRSVCPLCICQRDFEGEALLPLGSKQPPKTNNCIQEIVYMHQNTPHQKRKKEKKNQPWNISALAIELINISTAQPWLFMQAMRRLMRRSCKDNALTKVGYLLKDKVISQIPGISRARPGTRGCWSEPPETFRWMTAYE